MFSKLKDLLFGRGSSSSSPSPSFTLKPFSPPPPYAHMDDDTLPYDYLRIPIPAKSDHHRSSGHYRIPYRPDDIPFDQFVSILPCHVWEHILSHVTHPRTKGMLSQVCKALASKIAFDPSDYLKGHWCLALRVDLSLTVSTYSGTALIQSDPHHSHHHGIQMVEGVTPVGGSMLTYDGISCRLGDRVGFLQQYQLSHNYHSSVLMRVIYDEKNGSVHLAGVYFSKARNRNDSDVCSAVFVTPKFTPSSLISSSKIHNNYIRLVSWYGQESASDLLPVHHHKWLDVISPKVYARVWKGTMTVPITRTSSSSSLSSSTMQPHQQEYEHHDFVLLLDLDGVFGGKGYMKVEGQYDHASVIWCCTGRYMTFSVIILSGTVDRICAMCEMSQCLPDWSQISLYGNLVQEVKGQPCSQGTLTLSSVQI
eukprot:TRINITY_DN5435_c0_g1_i2.p1 TRINITY_DN5435_c0_g1~~TRINITY_DN5435_c0_g1_i2.p1  ORF type:complete len:422 (+),score=55.09 TRINITY_DN5435_c0_g1_i2:98-1363(+)